MYIFMPYYDYKSTQAKPIDIKINITAEKKTTVINRL